MKSHGMTLYAKEIKASRFEMIGGAPFLIGALTVLYILARQGRIPEFIPVIVAFAPLAIWHLAAVVMGSNSLRSEWQARTSYLLNTLPVPGWKVLGAKLLAIMTSYAGTSIVGIIAGTAMLKSLLHFELADILQVATVATLVKAGIGIYLVFTLSIVAFIVMAQLSYLASTLVSRFGWVLYVATFFASSWAIVRVGQLVGIAFQWLPDWYLPNVSSTGVVSAACQVHLGPFVGATLVIAGLFFVAARILERESEV